MNRCGLVHMSKWRVHDGYILSHDEHTQAVKAAGKAAAGDAVSQLVDIWGSKELFVTEYRSECGADDCVVWGRGGSSSL